MWCYKDPTNLPSRKFGFLVSIPMWCYKDKPAFKLRYGLFLFQFQCGAIKTLPLKAVSRSQSVSIPMWCYKDVQLWFGLKRSHLVSIPMWCYKDTLWRYVSYNACTVSIPMWCYKDFIRAKGASALSKFQFQCGAIKTKRQQHKHWVQKSFYSNVVL